MENPVPLRERRRGRGLLRDREKGSWVPPDIVPKDTTAFDAIADNIQFDFTLGGPLGHGDLLLLDSNQNHQDDTHDHWAIETYEGPMLDETELFDAISASFSEAIMCPSPITDMSLGTNAIFAGLPSVVELTRSDHHALDHFQKNLVFGTKTPIWSTHSILLQIGAQSPMTLHLILAASLAELRWKDRNWPIVDHDADKHFQIGKQMFMDALRSTEDKPDHVIMMASFWFMFLHQRRKVKRERTTYQELSTMMEAYVQKHRLDQTLPSSEANILGYLDTDGSSLELMRLEVTSPARSSVLARLAIWLFWADAQSCFQGGGGSLAKALMSSSPDRMAMIHERSRSTFELYWGALYPADEIRDDIQNASSLELLHRTWVVVQEINEASDLRYTGQEMVLDIGRQIDSMRQRFSSVFRLTDTTGLRDRLVGNADWAVTNFYALCIYFFRWSRRPSTDLYAPARHEFADDPITRVVAALLTLIQKALASGPAGQLDRLQWPLFWAGTETDDLIYREWILNKLVDPALHKALEMIFIEQPGGTRLGLDRIREICQDM